MSGNIPVIKILMIEDNPPDLYLNQALILDFLKKNPHLQHPIFAEATSLYGGLENLKTFEPDIILLDLNLPDSKGLDTFSSVSKCCPGTPIVILSGLRDEAVSFNAVKNGASHYLIKGEFDGKELITAIMESLEISNILKESDKLEKLPSSIKQK